MKHPSARLQRHVAVSRFVTSKRHATPPVTSEHDAVVAPNATA
jgi:hypothetical protein